MEAEGQGRSNLNVCSFYFFKVTGQAPYGPQACQCAKRAPGRPQATRTLSRSPVTQAGTTPNQFEQTSNRRLSLERL
jgi:hypothetical protein